MQDLDARRLLADGLKAWHLIAQKVEGIPKVVTAFPLRIIVLAPPDGLGRRIVAITSW